MNRYSTIRQVARDPGFPNEALLRAMVKSGVCPGIYSGNRFYVDVILLREMLDSTNSGNSRIEATATEDI